MELVSQDDETVTIRMSRSDEFALLYGLVLSVQTQYRALDPIELDMTPQQVTRLLRALEEVGARLPRPGESRV
jgi:hypothetical protein